MNWSPLLQKPAFYAHVISALLMVASIVLFTIHYAKLLHSDPIYLATILLVASITIALHGHSHMKLEELYGFDPIRMISVS